VKAAPPATAAPPVGRHVLLELCDCPHGLLDSVERLEPLLRACAEEGGATVVSTHFHRFAPQGVSGVVVIEESHVTIHTWPEYGYAAVDVFTCGREMVAERIAERIIERMECGRHETKSLRRQPPGTR
jgi:S-adenosylmethionine decarboxylase proenzyme